MATSHKTEHDHVNIIMCHAESKDFNSSSFGFIKNPKKNVACTNNDHYNGAPERTSRRVTYFITEVVHEADNLSIMNSINYNFYNATDNAIASKGLPLLTNIYNYVNAAL